MVEYIEKEFKSILNIRKSINNWFWDKYGINPYNGCQFGCIYCDSRSAKYKLPDDFENKIIIKKNADILLEKRLKNARKSLIDVIGIGGTTDPYQKAETIYKITRKCLEVILKYKFPVHIATKSPLILNDLELLEHIGKESWCTVSVTITTTDNKIAKFLEKRVPLPEKRFEIIKTIKEKTKHIQAGVLFIPVVPFLTDSEENIKNLLKKANESRADYVLFGGGMTMRDLQALWFLKHLKKEYPELIPLYEKVYSFKYNESSYTGTYEPVADYYLKPARYFLKYSREYNINWRIKRFIPQDYRKYNYIVSEELFNIAYERQITGRYWKPFYWAGYNIQNLKESIVEIVKRKELRTIKGIGPRLEKYIIELLNQRGVKI